MCKSKAEGGQRCYSHALEAWRVSARRVDRQTARVGQAREAAKSDPDNQDRWRDIQRAEAMREQAQQIARGHLVEMASTKEGERSLAERLGREENPEAREYFQSVYDDGQQLRQDNQVRARSNAAARLVVGVNGARYGLDEAQTEAVWRATLRQARSDKDDQEFADSQKWAAFVEREHAELDEDERLTDTQFGRARRNLDTAARTPPTRFVANASVQFQDRAERAAAALDRQVDLGAGMRGVSHDEYRERVAAFRKQYQELPENQRPAPPQDWVTGVTKKDRQATSMPDDPATQWAHYRAQSDPAAFPGADRGFVSVDIETAGPSGPSGFKPENGQIVEVGMVAYNENGDELGSYATLVKPRKEEYGTGATHIHHITEDMVKDAPSWGQVAPQVASRLRGRVMLAQNSPFEGNWLGHHMRPGGDAGQDGQDWEPRATLDTLRVAQQHHGNEERHTLDRICARAGVPYGEDGQGHRAEHDARVAARAWYGLRKGIESTYQADPKRRAITQPPKLAAKARPGPHTPTVKTPAAATGLARPRARPVRAAHQGTGNTETATEAVAAGPISAPASEPPPRTSGAEAGVSESQTPGGAAGRCPNCGQFAGASHTCPNQATTTTATATATTATTETTANPDTPTPTTPAHGAGTASDHEQDTTGEPLALVAAKNQFEGMRKIVDVPLADYAPPQVQERLRSEQFRTLINNEATTREAFNTAEQDREEGRGTNVEYHQALDAHRAAQAELLTYREGTARLLEGTGTTQEATFTVPDGVTQVAEAESGSAEWLRARQQTVGGSDVGGLVKVGQWGDLNNREVRESKLELDPQDQQNEGAAKVGDSWEPHLANIASDALGEQVYTNKGTYSDGSRHANLDGFTKDGDRVGTVVEMKTSSKPEDWEDTPPAGYVLQTQHYMSVLGAKDGILVANVNDDRLVVYRVEPTDTVQAGPRTNKSMGQEFSYDNVKDYCVSTVERWNQERETKRAEQAAGTVTPKARRRFELTDEQKATWRDAFKKGYVVVDLETTHTSPKRGHIVEFHGTDEQGRTFSSLYDVPDNHAAWNGTGEEAIHGINRGMLRGQPVLMEDAAAQARLKEFIGDRVVIAHNGDKFEGPWLKESGVEVRTADTMRAFGAVVDDTDAPDNTMKSLTEWAGVEYKDAHRAGPDVDMLNAALSKLLPRIEESTRDEAKEPVKVAS